MPSRWRGASRAGASILGAANDLLYGDAGSDSLSGNAGLNRFKCRDGELDRIRGGGGEDHILSSDVEDVYVPYK